MTKVRYRDAPHPLREFFFLFAVAFVVVMILTQLTQGPILRGATMVFGGSMLLIGLSFVTNFRGAAQFYSDLAKARTWLGTDYSKSVFNRPEAIRVVGIIVLLIGLVFLINGATGPL